jgi:hypothetical protein
MHTQSHLKPVTNQQHSMQQLHTQPHQQQQGQVCSTAGRVFWLHSSNRLAPQQQAPQQQQQQQQQQAPQQAPQQAAGMMLLLLLPLPAVCHQE